MNILKLLTQTGRRNLAREYLRETLTPEVAADWTSRAVNDTLMKAMKDIDDERLKKIVAHCAEGADLFKSVAYAVEDKVLTPDEASVIYRHIARLADGVIDQDRVNALIETVVSKIP